MTKLIKLYIYTICLLIIAGCTSPEPEKLPGHIEEKGLENVTVYAAGLEPPMELILHRDHIFGDSEEVLIGDLSKFIVDDEGRVYIADNQEMNIKVFAPDGSFISQISRQGRGPGDASYITNIQIQNNTLYLYDGVLQRMSAYSLDTFEYLYAINVNEHLEKYDKFDDGFLEMIYKRTDDTFLVEVLEFHHPEGHDVWSLLKRIHNYYIMDKDGQSISEKLFEVVKQYEYVQPPNMRFMIGTFDYLGKSIVALSDDDRIFQAWSQDFLIEVYGPDGEYDYAFYYPVDRVTLTPESIFSDSQTRNVLDSNTDFPEKWPILFNMLVDDQHRIWVSTIVEDKSVFEWWVLEENGDLLAKFSLPRNEQIEIVKNEFLYIRDTHDETGLEEVVRYHME